MKNNTIGSLASPCQNELRTQPRQHFAKTAAGIATGFVINVLICENALAGNQYSTSVPLYTHCRVYASRHPPDWDCTQILEEVFSDIKYADLVGVELMEIILRHYDAVSPLRELTQKYSLPVIGTSYNANICKKDEHQKILEDVEMVVERLHAGFVDKTF